MYIISKCLLGYNCKYDGGNNFTPWVKEFCQEHSYFVVCPECDGGLECPRVPSERVGNRVLAKDGKDVTTEFRRGSQISMDKSVKAAKLLGEKIEGAILKSNSPSCGFRTIYDGTFSGKLTEGNGVFADLLKERKIDLYTEKEKI